MTDWTRPAYVYLHIDADGYLLYVGCSSDVNSRNAVHRSRSPWYRLVKSTEVRGPYPLRKARDFERAVIEELDPPFNRQYTARAGNPDPWAAYLAAS